MKLKVISRILDKETYEHNKLLSSRVFLSKRSKSITYHNKHLDYNKWLRTINQLNQRAMRFILITFWLSSIYL